MVIGFGWVQTGAGIIKVRMVCTGIKDGEPIPASDKELIVPIVSQAFREAEGVSQLVADAVTDASREARKLTNK